MLKRKAIIRQSPYDNKYRKLILLNNDYFAGYIYNIRKKLKLSKKQMCLILEIDKKLYEDIEIGNYNLDKVNLIDNEYLNEKTI